MGDYKETRVSEPRSGEYSPRPSLAEAGQAPEMPVVGGEIYTSPSLVEPVRPVSAPAVVFAPIPTTKSPVASSQSPGREDGHYSLLATLGLKVPGIATWRATVERRHQVARALLGTTESTGAVAASRIDEAEGDLVKPAFQPTANTTQSGSDEEGSGQGIFVGSWGGIREAGERRGWKICMGPNLSRDAQEHGVNDLLTVFAAQEAIAA